ncbi:MAG: hypothetical protein WKG06_32215 [Segetibacter sp.]
MNVTSHSCFLRIAGRFRPFVYTEHAKELGEYMGKNNITLIYGGGKKD